MKSDADSVRGMSFELKMHSCKSDADRDIDMTWVSGDLVQTAKRPWLVSRDKENAALERKMEVTNSVHLEKQCISFHC